MSAPLGINAFFRVTHPSRAEDKVWDAVEEAIAEGRDTTWFMRTAAEAWKQKLEETAKEAHRALWVERT